MWLQSKTIISKKLGIDKIRRFKQGSNLGENEERETRSSVDIHVIKLKRSKSPKTPLAQSEYNKSAHKNV